MGTGRSIDQMLAWLIAIGLTLAIFAGFHFLTKNLRSIAEFDEDTGQYGAIETSKGLKSSLEETPTNEKAVEEKHAQEPTQAAHSDLDKNKVEKSPAEEHQPTAESPKPSQDTSEDGKVPQEKHGNH